VPSVFSSLFPSFSFLPWLSKQEPGACNSACVQLRAPYTSYSC
jgi:hypothetical protein